MKRQRTRKTAPGRVTSKKRATVARGGRDASPKESSRWSQHVTRTSNALDLEQGVFKFDDPRAIAQSLKRSAESSRRRKSSPYRSAQSMLTFYLNRAGKNLPEERKRILERSKDELRKLFQQGSAAPV